MKHNFKYVSRSKTPWSNKPFATPIEVFIDKHYKAHFEQRHPFLTDSDEISFLNSIEINSCKYCSSKSIVKRGFTKNKLQRYLCKDCNKSFNALTNTIFDNHKISISEWIEFLLNLFSHSSLSKTSKNNKNSITTTKYWLKKLFLVLEHYQDGIILKGNIYIDEAFYKARSNEVLTKPDGKEYRGLSINQYCIGVAYDKKKVYLKVQGRGKTSFRKTLECFQDHIKSDSHLIHDKEKSHSILVSTYNLTSEAYDGNELKKLKDKDNPLTPVNKIIDLMKKFLNSHSGFIREDLQGYLNLFAFIINEPKNPLEKVRRMVYLTVSTPISLKYRELYE